MRNPKSIDASVRKTVKRLKKRNYVSVGDLEAGQKVVY